MYIKFVCIVFLVAIDIWQTSLMWTINGNNGNFEAATKRNPMALYEGNSLCLNYVQWRQSHHSQSKEIVRYLIEYRLLWLGILIGLDRPYYKEAGILITLMIVINNCFLLNRHYVMVKTLLKKE